MIPDAWNKRLEAAVTEIDLWQAIQKGDPRKSPGDDGLPVEFYNGSKVMKEELLVIYNQMFQGTVCTQRQKHGAVVYTEKGDDSGV